jgi:hypothetical protein
VKSPDRDVISTALERQRCVSRDQLEPLAVERFVRRAISQLTDAPA